MADVMIDLYSVTGISKNCLIDSAEVLGMGFPLTQLSKTSVACITAALRETPSSVPTCKVGMLWPHLTFYPLGLDNMSVASPLPGMTGKEFWCIPARWVEEALSIAVQVKPNVGLPEHQKFIPQRLSADVVVIVTSCCAKATEIAEGCFHVPVGFLNHFITRLRCESPADLLVLGVQYQKVVSNACNEWSELGPKFMKLCQHLGISVSESTDMQGRNERALADIFVVCES